MLSNWNTAWQLLRSCINIPWHAEQQVAKRALSIIPPMFSGNGRLKHAWATYLTLDAKKCGPQFFLAPRVKYVAHACFNRQLPLNMGGIIYKASFATCWSVCHVILLQLRSSCCIQTTVKMSITHPSQFLANSSQFGHNFVKTSLIWRMLADSGSLWRPIADF